LGLIPAESSIVPFWETGQMAQWLNQASHGPLQKNTAGEIRRRIASEFGSCFWVIVVISFKELSKDNTLRCNIREDPIGF
jgi:hypothetical protein